MLKQKKTGTGEEEKKKTQPKVLKNSLRSIVLARLPTCGVSPALHITPKCHVYWLLN